MRVRVCKLDELNLVKDFEAGGFDGIVIRSKDRLVACPRYCPHKGFPLDFGRFAEDHILHCTLHGSEFDLRDGHVTEPPCTTPLRLFPVIVDQDTIYVDVPDEVASEKN